MSDTAYKMLAKEAKVLEYWRKKYLGQAAMVLIAAAGAMAAAWFYVGAALLKLLFSLCAVLVAYLMLKELRESLQTRGEMLIFAKGKDLFADVVFDYGQGLDKGDKLWEAWEYNVRECRGVLFGEGYLLEEDWLYNTAAAKFWTLKMTVFEGVLLAAVCPAGKENALADRQEIRAAGEKMRRMLGAKKMRIVAGEGRIGFYFQTPGRMFHQFGLWRPNAMGAFVRRVEALKTLAAEISALAKVDKR